MGFASYSHLILQISGQTLQVTIAREIFWELNGLLVEVVLLTEGEGTQGSLNRATTAMQVELLLREDFLYNIPHQAYPKALLIFKTSECFC